jgi:membrane-associated phospholipid phosphatase
VAVLGDQDAAPALGPRARPPVRPPAESEAILTAEDEIRLADAADAADAAPDSDAAGASAGQADLAPDSATASAGLADLPRLTPAQTPVPRSAAIAIAVATGLAFALLSVWVARRGTAVPAVDREIHRWALAQRGPATIAIARAVRWGGTSYVVLPALIVIGAAAAPRGRGLARRLGSGLLPCLVASTGVYAEIWVNHLIDRARPPVADWAGAASGASFPSGHTTAATMFALSCAWTIAGRVRPGWPRGAVWAGAGAYALTVGWSRVWLGVHWPTDVTAGWLFSAAWTAGFIAAITLPAWRPAVAQGPAGDQGPAGEQDPAGEQGPGQSRPRSRSRTGRPSGS